GCIDGQIKAKLFLGGVLFYDIDTPVGLLRVTVQNTGLAQPEEGGQVGVFWAKNDLQLVGKKAASNA
ncbi:hypothetical protein, partial [Roseobacter sp. GAI101]|uniref:hypothetical protein n=1 Tax=Roseobacter sp. (strain GAI101) TaxID=391589 RepID=UPI000565AD16